MHARRALGYRRAIMPSSLVARPAEPSRRLLLRLAAAGALGLAGAAAAQRPTPERTSVTLAVGGKTSLPCLPLTIAEQLGYFKDEGLQVEIPDFAGGAKALQALVGGSADVVSGAYEHTINMQAKNQSIESFVLQGRAPQIVLAVSTKTMPGYKTIADLKGKKIAHTSPSSNTGNLAPRALFPDQGLVPDKDYQPVFSGKHDQSILGVKSGDYDAAPVASDVLKHMTERGVVGADDFRVIYTSAVFPTDSYAYAHDLHPDLVKKIKQCFFDYRIPPEMAKGLGGDRFLPAEYKKDWALVRQVAVSAGQNLGNAGYEAERKKEEAKAKK